MYQFELKTVFMYLEIFDVNSRSNIFSGDCSDMDEQH